MNRVSKKLRTLCAQMFAGIVETDESGTVGLTIKTRIDTLLGQVERLEGIEETVNAFKQGSDGILKLSTEIVEGRQKIAQLRIDIDQHAERIKCQSERIGFLALETAEIIQLRKDVAELAHHCGCLEPNEEGKPSCDSPCVACRN